MVGLSVVLEGQMGNFSKKIPQVINKTTMIINKQLFPSFSSPSGPSIYQKNISQPSPLPPTFLNECFLCKQKLLPGNDIYMYRGDRAFCSVECRCRQILMDEEESVLKDNCLFSAIQPTSSSAAAASSSSSSHQHRKGNRNRTGGFDYKQM